MRFDRVNPDLLTSEQKSLDNYGTGCSTNPWYENAENATQRALLEQKYEDRFVDAGNLNKLVTYHGNKETPFLSIYRYKEAFSFQLVDMILRNFEDEDLTVFDPYSGMGTTLFASAVNEVEAYAIDRLPLAVQMSNSILDSVVVDLAQVEATFEEIKDNLETYNKAEIADDVNVISRVFPEETLSELQQWKSAIDQISEQKVQSTLNMIFLSVLIDCSYAKNSGQFLRTDKSQEIRNPEKAIAEKIEILARSKQAELSKSAYKFFETNRAFRADSRAIDIDIPEPNMIITSPPYPNRYDYTRSYSLELAFDSVSTNQELIDLRHDLLRSHIESKVEDDEFTTNHPVVQEVLDNLSDKELNNSKIPDMIVGYFADMRKSFTQFSELLADQSRIFLVVDNVRYEGEVIPVDLILSDIAADVGFELEKLLITRYKGNSSQQMGKYERVPVRESILWLSRNEDT